MSEVLLMIITALLGVFTTIAIGIWQGQRTMIREFSELKGGLQVSIPELERRVTVLEEKVFK